MESKLQKISISEKEIQAALQLLREVQTRDGFITQKMMFFYLNPDIALYLLDNGYLEAIRYTGDPKWDWMQLSNKALQVAYSKQDIFDNVYGWAEYKAKFTKILSDPHHGYVGLLYGASRTGKSEFLNSFQRLKGVPIVHLSGGQESSPAGTLAKVKEAYDAKGDSNFIIVFDEIDKVPPTVRFSPMYLKLFDADSSRGIMRNKATREGESDSFYIPLPYTKIFAAANNLRDVAMTDDLKDDPFLKRFELIPFMDYTEESFINVAMELMMKKLKKTRDFAFAVANYCWKHGINIGQLEEIARQYETIDEFNRSMEVIEKNRNITDLQQKQFGKLW